MDPGNRSVTDYFSRPLSTAESIAAVSRERSTAAMVSQVGGDSVGGVDSGSGLATTKTTTTTMTMTTPAKAATVTTMAVNDLDARPSGKKRKRNTSSMASANGVGGDPGHDHSHLVPNMADGQSHSLSEIDAIILQKRKPREKTSCHPCRKRKVGCDRRLPCQTCIDRRHPEVCVYESVPNDQSTNMVGNNNSLLSTTQSPLGQAASESQNGSATYSQDSINVPRDLLERLFLKIDRLEKSMFDLSADIRALSARSSSHSQARGTESHPNSPYTGRRIPSMVPDDGESRNVSIEGVHTRNEFTGQTVHVGGNSVPALVMALARNQSLSFPGTELRNPDIVDLQELTGQSLLPLFGLDNESATYPFVDLWSSTQDPLTRLQHLAEALPSDEDANLFINSYRDTAHVVFPGIVDMKKFEQHVMEFHKHRAQVKADGKADQAVTEQAMYGKSISWMAMFFAALAAGAQCTELPRKRRDFTAKVFVCCSFECLRLTNFVACPALESVQAMLVFNNVMANSLNPGVSWAMLGLIIRLAQTLGLHKKCTDDTPIHVKSEKAKVWWAIIWQDSLLSITYDRATSTSSLDGQYHYPPDFNSRHGHWGFEECMYRLCSVGLDIVRERAAPQEMYEMLNRMSEHERALSDIMNGAADHIKSFVMCRNGREKLQYWAFYLHKSYIMSELCRPAINPNTPNDELSDKMRRTCIENLTNTVQAFLGLHNLTVFACRSWAAMHRSLSSALLLGVLGEPIHNSDVRILLTELLTCLEEVTTGLDKFEISAPIERSIQWLKKITASANATSTGSTPMFDFGPDESPGAMMQRMLFGIESDL